MGRIQWWHRVVYPPIWFSAVALAICHAIRHDRWDHCNCCNCICQRRYARLALHFVASQRCYSLCLIDAPMCTMSDVVASFSAMRSTDSVRFWCVVSPSRRRHSFYIRWWSMIVGHCFGPDRLFSKLMCHHCWSICNVYWIYSCRWSTLTDALGISYSFCWWRYQCHRQWHQSNWLWQCWHCFALSYDYRRCSLLPN